MNKDLIEEIIKLSKYVFGFDQKTFDWYCSKNNVDGCEISIKDDKLTIATWCESRHNGSSYGYHAIVIDDESEQNKLLLSLKEKLTAQAFDKMQEELIREERRAQQITLKEKCQNRLRTMGLLK